MSSPQHKSAAVILPPPPADNDTTAAFLEPLPVNDDTGNDTSSKGLLHIPLIPSRPSSPGNVSIPSQDEWLSLQPQAQPFSLRDPKSWRPAFDRFWIRNLGLLYMLLAQIFGTAMNVAVRTLEVEGNDGKGLHPFQILFVRMIITVALSTSYMAYTCTPYFPFGMPEVRLLLVARGMGGFFGVFGMWYSLRYLPVADATVLSYLAPGLACWVCSFLIGEAFTRVDRIGTLVSLCGVVFIARPVSLFASPSSAPQHDSALNGTAYGNVTMPVADSSDFDSVSPTEHIRAVGMGLIGVCGAVAAIVTIRWIGTRAHPLISTNYFAVWCTIVSFVAQLVLPGVGFILPANMREWGLLIFLGVCGFTMQFFLAAGLSYEKSSRATNMTYTSMLFALASDKFFFDTSPGISSIMGSVLILGAAIVMALQKSQPAAAKPVRENVASDEERGLMSNMDESQHVETSAMHMREMR